MNSTTNFKADGKARFLVLMTAVSALALTLRLQDWPITTAVCGGINKVHQVQRDADEVVQFSRRLYRFYKLSEEKPTPVARNN